MKYAVVIPGIGYHTDKPILYYSKKIAKSCGYTCIELAFHGLGGKKGLIGNEQKMREVFEEAYAQAEENLDLQMLSGASSLLFLSKSVGTVVGAAYAVRHKNVLPPVHHIFYTPVAGTFAFMEPESGIAFHGTADPWVDTDTVVRGCEEKQIPLYLTEGANHSLETGNVLRDLEEMHRIMEITDRYIRGLSGNTE